MCTDLPQLKVSLHRDCDYRPMWKYQTELMNEIIGYNTSHLSPPKEYLLLVEHKPVYTLGKHGHEENMLSAALLKRKDIELIRIERGGDITYHGPGQLVVYPIISLTAHKLGVKDYVYMLEEAVIRLLETYNIKSERVEGATGVWIGKDTPEERKICAIGVKCSRHATMHGLALNVNTDLSAFTLINPCGFVDKGVTSISQELHREIDFEEVAERFSEIFKALLQKSK